MVHQSTPDKCLAPCLTANIENNATNATTTTTTTTTTTATTTTTEGRVKTGCETAKPGSGACWDEVEWARTRGIHEHPEWYPGLGPGSSVEEFQQMVHQSTPDKCPAPCLTANIGLWCNAQEAPELWGPDLTGPAVNVKVLAYNLFWWNLFGLRGGNGNSAGRLISGSMDPEPFDFMGFQECESPERVLGPVGLLNEYATVRGTHAICAAYRKTTWELLAHGEGDVGEDIATNHYGRRGAQWLRLKHKENGKVVFFVNHHGPLAVNSGGTCGGTATAVNLMKLMATHGQRGDALVLVGDFNANAASLTIQSMWSKLVHVFNGVSFGGVDNIFSNIPLSHVVRTENLGSGGSDHDAIAAVMQLGGADPSPGPRAGEPLDALRAMTGTGHPGDDWQHFWCGLMESDIAYVVASDTWSKRLDHQLPTTDVASPSRCCRICQREADCRSWKWEKNGSPSARPACWLQGEAPEAKVLKMGAVSGLPASTAAVLATRASAMALVAMP